MFISESRSSSPSHIISPVSSRRSSCEEIVIFPLPERPLAEPNCKENKKVNAKNWSYLFHKKIKLIAVTMKTSKH